MESARLKKGRNSGIYQLVDRTHYTTILTRISSNAQKIVIKCLLFVFPFWSWNTKKLIKLVRERKTYESGIKAFGASDAHWKKCFLSARRAQKERKPSVSLHKLNFQVKFKQLFIETFTTSRVWDERQIQAIIYNPRDQFRGRSLSHLLLHSGAHKYLNCCCCFYDGISGASSGDGGMGMFVNIAVGYNTIPY